jgi:hypothetical protein
MLILLGYGLCLGFALVVAILLFAFSVVCLVVDEASLQLGPFVRIVVFRQGHPTSKLAAQPGTQAKRCEQVVSDRGPSFPGIRG